MPAAPTTEGGIHVVVDSNDLYEFVVEAQVRCLSKNGLLPISRNEQTKQQPEQ
jgi:hypothetical protein